MSFDSLCFWFLQSFYLTRHKIFLLFNSLSFLELYLFKIYKSCLKNINPIPWFLYVLAHFCDFFIVFIFFEKDIRNTWLLFLAILLLFFLPFLLIFLSLFFILSLLFWLILSINSDIMIFFFLWFFSFFCLLFLWLVWCAFVFFLLFSSSWLRTLFFATFLFFFELYFFDRSRGLGLLITFLIPNDFLG